MHGGVKKTLLMYSQKGNGSLYWWVKAMSYGVWSKKLSILVA